MTDGEGAYRRLSFGRAVPTGCDLENDPSGMVQEQLARLKFAAAKLGFDDKSVLDWGCGTGFNVHYLMTATKCKAAVGFDNFEAAVEFAKRAYPRGRFFLADALSPYLNLGSFDRIIACEVIEHVRNTHLFLRSLVRHLDPEGAAFISTPNMEVFSLGHSPSPINETHVREFRLDEFRELLHQYFDRVELFGQTFADERVLKRQIRIVEKKVRGFRLLGKLWWCDPIRWSYDTLTGEAFRILSARLLGRSLHNSHFKFVHNEVDKAFWFVALVSRPKSPAPR